MIKATFAYHLGFRLNRPAVRAVSTDAALADETAWQTPRHGLDGSSLFADAELKFHRLDCDADAESHWEDVEVT